MNIDPDVLRSHYRELSDRALLDLNPQDLTDIARQYYEVELSNRGLKRPLPPKLEEPEPVERDRAPSEPSFFIDNLPWRSSAVCAGEFEDTEEAEKARDVLEQASIPSALAVKNQDPMLGYKRRYRGKWISLMVPSSSLDAARETLRAEIEVPCAEEDYSNHFVEFSDEELLDVDTEALPEAGRKWYSAELAKRGLADRVSPTTPHSSSETVAAADGLISVATLLQAEVAVASRFLERASIPYRVERDDSQGGVESFDILVPAWSFDQAAEILNRHEAEIFKPEPIEENDAPIDPA